MNYSENQLIALAKNNPHELVRILNSPGADIRMLANGAETLGGEVTDEKLVIPTLMHLLKHVHTVVREGALMGISTFYFGKKPPQEILDKLIFISNHDPSPTIREDTKSFLQGFEDK